MKEINLNNFMVIFNYKQMLLFITYPGFGGYTLRAISFSERVVIPSQNQGVFLLAIDLCMIDLSKDKN